MTERWGLDTETETFFGLGRFEETPLFLAARECNVEAVSVLLERGADLEARTLDGYTPLLGVLKCKERRAAESQPAEENKCKREGGWLPFQPQPLCLEVLELLLEAGSDIDTTSKDGVTPLQLASAGTEPWHREAASRLRERAAQADARSINNIVSTHAPTV